MRFVTKHTTAETISLNDDQRKRLSDHLTNEIEDAISSRTVQEDNWRDLLRQYEGVPKNPVKNVPIENAPNIEITLGAISADSIFAQAYDLIYTMSPLLTCRATNANDADDAARKLKIKTAEAIQRFSEHVATTEAGLRPASYNSILDDVQLGTGIYYIPWVHEEKKSKSMRTLDRGPRIFTVPPEDFFVMGGEYDDLQQARLVAMRQYYTTEQLNQRKTKDWNLTGIATAANIDWVRSRRELLGRTSQNKHSLANLYEIFDCYPYFDIDEDGINEDLFVVFDRTSRNVLYASYAPYDHRPFEAMRYQLRAHLFYGLGVLEMVKAFQQGVSDFFNHWTTNSLLANCRIWRANPGVLPDPWNVWPGKVVEAEQGSFEGIAMADVYPSGPTAIGLLTQLADHRVGSNAMSQPRPSQVMGSRTPGITAISLLQQVNRRFTPAFDDIKLATSGAVKQCLYRYSEQLLAGDLETMDYIRKVMGDEEGNLVIDALKDENFDNNIVLELTASSASVNKEADRQNSVMLVNLLAQYYQKALELVTIAANPQVPEPVREVAKKIAEASGNLIERTLRTFDGVRDPATFIVEFEAELDKAAQVANDPMQKLMAMMGGGAQNGGVGG